MHVKYRLNRITGCCLLPSCARWSPFPEPHPLSSRPLPCFCCCPGASPWLLGSGSDVCSDTSVVPALRGSSRGAARAVGAVAVPAEGRSSHSLWTGHCLAVGPVPGAGRALRAAGRAGQRRVKERKVQRLCVAHGGCEQRPEPERRPFGAARSAGVVPAPAASLLLSVLRLELDCKRFVWSTAGPH